MRFPWDRKYDLTAGLVELTYHAGIRIILQGRSVSR